MPKEVSFIAAIEKVIIATDKCKGCGLCTIFCPKKILELSEDININGYHPVICLDQERCISCANCATICPDACIEIYEEVPYVVV